MTPLIWWLLLAGPLWSAVGAVLVPRTYRRHGLDPRLARASGGAVGAATGLFGLVPLLTLRPPLRRATHYVFPVVVLVAELFALVRISAPDNVCVSSPPYVASQVGNGLVFGAILATVAVGLTMIFSVLKVVSFAHGQFVMLGGVTSYLLLTGPMSVNAAFAIPVVGVLGLLIGVFVERTLLSPMTDGRVERRDEYAILITFGFGIFLQYALMGILGPTAGLRAPRYTDRPVLGLDRSTFTVGGITVATDSLIAGVLGAVLCVLLALYLRYTWGGRSLRAVSMDAQAASVAGIDSARTFTLAFSLGTALAAMAGAAMVPMMNFPLPGIASQMAVRSYVIVVLGGLGSVPGAFLGGLFIGVVEALGSGCYPDPSKGAIYQPAFGLIIFALVLLARPQGFFGRSS